MTDKKQPADKPKKDKGGRRPKGQRPDWDGIYREFLAGQLSNEAIGKIFGVSGSAISQYAKLRGWKRNLSKQVRDQTSAILIEGEATAQTEGEAIDTAAARAVEVIRRHRKDISALGTQRDKLVTLLETPKGDAGKTMLDKITCWDDAQTAAQVIESLARTTARLIPLERQAFNLDEEQGGDSGDFLDRLKKGRERALHGRDFDDEEGGQE